ncbi:cell division protein FtsQ/DivIB [Desulfosediminicola flagellatus]|uniref:cell division protein FtsQ/DivIB n=1 Tax=Desulfosediminicola flagellatus TaxID=2569541 RepID=UPI0010AC4872|nr:FtsQ-type POTRA domain-containing protein [Desulfosediminicola flagellatus]
MKGLGRKKLKLRAHNWRRKLRDVSDFLRQCCRELSGEKKRRVKRNSDLQGHNFASMPEPTQRRKKNFLSRFKVSLPKKRKVEVESYISQSQLGLSKKLKAVPVIFVVVIAVSIFALDGPGYLGRKCENISTFKVRNIDIVGCESTSEKRLRPLAGITIYQTSLMGLDGESIESRIEQDPWVSKAEVTRDWPSTIVIKVVEHQPVALLNKSETTEPKLYYIDKKGVPFLEVKPGNDVDFPVITGLDKIEDVREREEIFSDIYTFLRLVRRNNPNLPAQSVSEIHVNENSEMVVYLVDYTFPIFFGRGQISDKYTRLVRVLDVLYREKKKGMLLSGVEYIRMDYLKDKVLVAQSESG